MRNLIFDSWKVGSVFTIIKQFKRVRSEPKNVVELLNGKARIKGDNKLEKGEGDETKYQHILVENVQFLDDTVSLSVENCLA